MTRWNRIIACAEAYVAETNNQKKDKALQKNDILFHRLIF